MPNGIQGLPARINPYLQAQQTPELRQPAAADPATPAAANKSAAPTEGLSAAEQQMISDRFPASKHMSMRLYGPGQSARVIDAGAVGARLDLQG